MTARCTSRARRSCRSAFAASLDLEITTYGPVRAVHSGHYGNWAPNPAAALAQLLASMRDAEGRILIQGFAEAVRPLSAAERAAIDAAPAEDDAIARALALGRREAVRARLVDAITIPALNVRGLRAGEVGEKAANAVPTQAQASIDFRLVPDLTPELVRRLVEAHIEAQGYHIVTTVTRRDHAPDISSRRVPRMGYRLSRAIGRRWTCPCRARSSHGRSGRGPPPS